MRRQELRRVPSFNDGSVDVELTFDAYGNGMVSGILKDGRKC